MMAYVPVVVFGLADWIICVDSQCRGLPHAKSCEPISWEQGESSKKAKRHPLTVQDLLR